MRTLREIRETNKLTLYHRTNKENADRIHKTGNFTSKENTNETFFSTHRDSEQTKGYGDHVVAVRVHPKHARLDDEFPNGEQHYAVSNRVLTKRHIVKRDS
jgi:lipopolysaccharide biosynthesis protein